MIERCEVGFRPRRVATLFGRPAPVVYDGQRRCPAGGLVGLTRQPRTDTPLPLRVAVQARLAVFQLLDTHALVGHDRVTMALDALGDRYGHTTVWPLGARSTQAPPPPLREPRVPHPAARPQATPARHQAWWGALRDLVQGAGPWRASGRIFDGERRASASGGERHTGSRLLHGFRHALPQGGAPEAVVRAHGAVLVALAPCLRQLKIEWAPTPKGHPGPKRAASGCALQRRMLEASVVGGTEREQVSHRHAQCVRDEPCGGHWAHTRPEAQGRVSSLSPAGRRGGVRSLPGACGGPYASASGRGPSGSMGRCGSTLLASRSSKAGGATRGRAGCMTMEGGWSRGRTGWWPLRVCLIRASAGAQTSRPVGANHTAPSPACRGGCGRWRASVRWGACHASAGGQRLDGCYSPSHSPCGSVWPLHVAQAVEKVRGHCITPEAAM
jgi:hypothetical protein